MRTVLEMLRKVLEMLRTILEMLRTVLEMVRTVFEMLRTVFEIECYTLYCIQIVLKIIHAFLKIFQSVFNPQRKAEHEYNITSDSGLLTSELEEEGGDAFLPLTKVGG